jgi:hypothetical protein
MAKKDGKKTIDDYEKEVEGDYKTKLDQTSLEGIAEHLGGIEEEYNVGQLDPIIANAFRNVEGIYDEKTGKYVEDYIGKRGQALKKAMADAVVDSLGDHIYKNILKKKGAQEVLKMLKEKDPGGKSIQDILVKHYFGIEREDFYKTLRGMRNINQQTIAQLIGKIQQDHVQSLKSEYLRDNVKPYHAGDLSECFKS